MRIALDYTSQIGIRSGRLLLGEPDLTFLGVVRREVKDHDVRLGQINDLSGFDAVVTDDPESAILAEAVTFGVPCVLWADGFPDSDEAGDIPVLHGSNLVAGIGRSLAQREAEIAGPAADILLAWTEPGKPIRRGEPITFPEPVGARWGARRAMTNRRVEIAAPVGGEWAGVVVQTTTNEERRILGIADLAPHLEAIALAAGGVAAASGLVPPGVHRPEELADDYLLAALRIGLDIASFTSTD